MAPYLDGHYKITQHLGSCIDVGPTMTAKNIKENS